jgi:hypothetical protein
LLKSEVKANLAVEKSVEIGLPFTDQFERFMRDNVASFAAFGAMALVSVGCERI